MAFLTINGITVPCSVDEGSGETIDQVGESKRAVDGTMRVHRRVTKFKESYGTTPQLLATSLAFRDLVLGKGHYWSFDANLYSSKGLGPSAATASIYSAGSAYLGAGKLSQTLSTGTITFTALPLITGGPWTVMFARKIGAGSWTHFVVLSSGSVYTNGALTGTAAFLTVTPASGTVTLAADASSTTLVDELVILPYLVPTDWPAQMYAYNNGGSQWSKLGQLLALGDSVEGGARAVAVMGHITSLKTRPGAVTAAAGFKTANRSLMFDLEEI